MTSLERDRIPSPRPVPSREVPLVDRTEEMNVLKEAVYKVIHGEGSLVFIHGEAGIGKTRLIRELTAYARSCGVKILSGRCPAPFRMDGVPPYLLWKEVIKDYLDVCTPEQLYRVIGFYPAEVVKLVPELSQKLRAIPQSFPISPEQEQNRLSEAVSQLITNISRETPLVVVLDDLQWTDPSSLRLLLYIANCVQKTPLLLIGAYRSTDIDDKHPLTPLLTELNRERLLQSIALKRMSLEDISSMIQQILEQDEIPSEFCNMIYEKTRGNPFFAEEVIESLKEEEIIYQEENRWKIREIPKIEFPKTVKSVIKARIGRLDNECQSLLTVASFVGNDFSFEELSGITGIEENQLLETVEKTLKTGLIKERVIPGGEVYRFADIIIRDVVHEEVSHLRHKKLHGEVGRALERTYAQEIDEHLGELAYHFLEAGEKNKALEYFLRAGEKSQKMYAYNEAFSFLSRALSLLEEKDASIEEIVKITERLGDIKSWTGQFDAGLEYWNRALKLWAQIENRKNVSKLHVKMAHAFWNLAGDKKKASEHHQIAMEILEEEPESRELASLYEDIGHRLWRSGNLLEALSWVQKALNLAEDLGDSTVLAECYDDLGALTLGELGKTKGYWEQGLNIALESDSLEAALRLYCNLCELYRLIGEPQKAVETVQKGLELAKKVGDLNLLVWIDSNLALCYMDMGDVQKALEMFENDLALSKRTRNVSYTPHGLLCIGECYLWFGEYEKSFQYLTEAVNLAKKAEEFESLGNATLRLGKLFMEKGKLEEAEGCLTESNSMYEKAGETTGQFFETYPAISQLYLKEGEIGKASKLIRKTLEYAVTSKNGVLTATAEMLEGMLSSAQKKWENSLQHFEKSFLGYKSVSADKYYVRQFADLLYEYGSTYLGRKEKGDEEKAFSLLNQALEIYEEIGAMKRVEKTRSRMILREAAHETVLKPKPTAEVSESRQGQVATGYTALDKLLLGGIPSNYAVAFTSPSCDERDLLINCFLETGAKNGEVAFYVTINPGSAKTLAEQFQSNFSLFVCNPQADAIVKDAPNIFKLKGVENLTSISIALTSAIRKLDPSMKGPRRICIDLISDVLLQHHVVQTRRWLTSMLAELRSAGFTTLAVMDPRMHSAEEFYAILGLFQGEISLYEKETEKGPEKYLRIKRMSDRRYLESELRLRE